MDSGGKARLMHWYIANFLPCSRGPRGYPLVLMASDIFAKLGDIKGESIDDKHKDEIEVLSFSWGVRTLVP
ncbi:MAG: hypothetical protein Udaeo2_19210 [Candidatus Udaeobacter sp.]|nr:MAG: hypothetical protein Udaeo2_19210 [Candidatus Udaeobacter sp.]